MVPRATDRTAPGRARAATLAAFVLGALGGAVALPVLAQDDGSTAGTDIRVRGIRLGLPSDGDSPSEGGLGGSIGYMELVLNYQRTFNYFLAGSLAVDLFTKGDEADAARDVEDLPSDLAYRSDSSYQAVMLSAGATFNLNAFDNVVLFAGPTLSFGDTLAESVDGQFFKVEDQRFGVMGGVLVALGGFFIAGDYSTTTDSVTATLSYGF